MQTLAAYCFTAELSCSEADGRAAFIESEISKWLAKKGSKSPENGTGKFISSTNKKEDGHFARNRTTSKLGTVRNTTLVESAHTGQIFTTSIQSINDQKSITVFATLSVSSENNIIAPRNIYPRCPNVIRSIIHSYSDWTFGGKAVPNGDIIDAKGNRAGYDLCKMIVDTERNFPIVVVSIDQDEVVWDGIANKVAKDMVGLAHVAIVDEDGSWVMTEELGKSESCYLGAIRLYWPISVGRKNVSLRGTVWTSRQLGVFGSEKTGMNEFQSVLRKNIMSVAALSITPPSITRSILTSAISDKISEAERNAVEKELNSLAEENDSLLNKLQQANNRISELEAKTHELRREIERIKANHDYHVEEVDADSVAPIKRGDLIYYKKIASGGGVDTLLRTKPCKHKESSWQSAFKADQAVKGIIKLEGRDDWQSIQHCGACTGGGKWRVRW